MRFLLVLFTVLLLAVAGCGGSVNWEQKEGKYTYAEAVEELGQPTACQDLEQGESLCAWYGGSSFGWANRLMLRFAKDGTLLHADQRSDSGF